MIFIQEIVPPAAVKDALKTVANTVPEKFTEVLQGVQDKVDVADSTVSGVLEGVVLEDVQDKVDEAAPTVSGVLVGVNDKLDVIPIPGLIRYVTL